MGSTRPRRPPTPTAAERARSIAARGGIASLVGTGTTPTSPLVHHVHADGSAVLLLADGEPALGMVRAEGVGGCSVMLELTDCAPVDLHEPVRALLWITGLLHVPDPAAARRIAMSLVEVCPDPDLLDLGNGATLVQLEPRCVVLSDAEGNAVLARRELAAARADPFCRVEQPWLAHLEHAHPAVFDALARHLPPALRDVREARIRPLGVDRYGLRLRVEAPDGDHDVRLAWRREAATADELRTQLELLVGCSFRDGSTTQREPTTISGRTASTFSGKGSPAGQVTDTCHP